jgi:hypothetical protein
MSLKPEELDKGFLVRIKNSATNTTEPWDVIIDTIVKKDDHYFVGYEGGATRTDGLEGVPLDEKHRDILGFKSGVWSPNDKNTVEYKDGVYTFYTKEENGNKIHHGTHIIKFVHEYQKLFFDAFKERCFLPTRKRGSM